jgi:hypothetical protein
VSSSAILKIAQRFNAGFSDIKKDQQALVGRQKDSFVPEGTRRMDKYFTQR